MIDSAAIAAKARAENEAYQELIRPTLERAAFWKRPDEMPASAAPLTNMVHWITAQFQLFPDGKNKKIPLDYRGFHTSYNDERNHICLSEAVYRCRARPEKNHTVGFVFTGERNIVGIDCDTYKVAEGTVVWQIIQNVLKFRSMQMRSLSGKGTHLYVKVTDKAVLKRLGSQRQHLLGAIDIYSTNGFFVVTFDMANDLPIVDGDEVVSYILDMHEQYVGKLPDNGDYDASHHTVPLDIDIVAYVKEAKFYRPDIEDRFATPITQEQQKAQPKIWSLMYRNIVSDLSKPGILALYDLEQLRKLIWEIVRRSRFVTHSWDDPAVSESRYAKAERLLMHPMEDHPEGTPSTWWNKIVAENAAMKLIPRGADESAARSLKVEK